MAQEKDICFIHSLNFFNSKSYIIPKEIGRINQNLKFARKYKIPSIVNYIVKYPAQIKTLVELESIVSFFDLSSMQKTGLCEILEKKIKENRLKKSENYVSKDIEILE